MKTMEQMLSITLSEYSEGNLTEITEFLFELDQILFNVLKVCQFTEVDRSVLDSQAQYFIGQLLLHTVSVQFIMAEGKEERKAALPLLLLGHKLGIVATMQAKSSFRMSQIAHTLTSCISGDADTFWMNEANILDDAHSISNDPEWRSKLFFSLFSSEEHSKAITTSFIVQSQVLKGPYDFEWPNKIDTLLYDLKSQQVDMSNLARFVYLSLASPDFKLVALRGLSVNAENLNDCSAETLCQFDVDAFLFSVCLQAKSNINGSRILPFSNMATRLCTNEQMCWWINAHKVSN